MRGGAILMVLVVFEHFHTRWCCFQRYGYIYGISVREDDDLEVRGGIYIQYFASAHNGAVLQAQGGGVFTALASEEMLRYINEITKSAFCNVCTTVILVVISGACTQTVDTVFLF